MRVQPWETEESSSLSNSLSIVMALVCLEEATSCWDTKQMERKVMSAYSSEGNTRI